MLITPTELAAGVALDLAFGDPRWVPHPVRGIGWLAHKSERFFRATRLPLRIAGVVFCLFIVTAVALFVWTTVRFANSWATVYWIYSLLACRDLDIEAGRVIDALNQHDTQSARQWLSWIVGRDTAALSEPEIVRATVETVAENLSDGVIAPLFYLALAGPAGMAAYKAINTLDSMVGHKNERYRDFGWASARLDDVVNFVPARLTAVLIWMAALLPGFRALRSMRITLRDGGNQPSPNSGFPEAAFAGALGVQLGGMNYYAGEASLKASLGDAIVELNRAIFGRVRILLYASEALCVAVMMGFTQWR